MVDEFKADVSIKNRQGLTPLTLAAKFARIEVWLTMRKKITDCFKN